MHGAEPNDEIRAWRKPGQKLRMGLLERDISSNNGFVLRASCPIEKYHRVSEKVLEQFLDHPIESRQELLEAYLVGMRLLKFLTEVLPTHPEYHSSDVMAKKSTEYVRVLRTFVEEIAILIDRDEHETYISKIIVNASREDADRLMQEQLEQELSEDISSTFDLSEQLSGISTDLKKFYQALLSDDENTTMSHFPLASELSSHELHSVRALSQEFHGVVPAQSQEFHAISSSFEKSPDRKDALDHASSAKASQTRQLSTPEDQGWNTTQSFDSFHHAQGRNPHAWENQSFSSSVLRCKMRKPISSIISQSTDQSEEDDQKQLFELPSNMRTVKTINSPNNSTSNNARNFLEHDSMTFASSSQAGSSQQNSGGQSSYYLNGGERPSFLVSRLNSENRQKNYSTSRSKLNCCLNRSKKDEDGESANQMLFFLDDETTPSGVPRQQNKTTTPGQRRRKTKPRLLDNAAAKHFNNSGGALNS